MENHDPMIAAMQRQLDARFDASVKTMGAAGPSLAPRAGVHTMALDPGSVHVNAPLANVLIFFKNRKGIADEVSPVIPVAKQSDVYFVYPADTAFDTAKIPVICPRVRVEIPRVRIPRMPVVNVPAPVVEVGDPI